MQRNPIALVLLLIVILGGAFAWLFLSSAPTTPAQPSVVQQVPEPADAPKAPETEATPTPEQQPEPERAVENAPTRTEAAAPEAEQDSGSWDAAKDGETALSGIVLDPSGAPLPGAEVRAYNPPRIGRSTDDDLPVNISFGGARDLLAMGRPAAITDAAGRFRVSIKRPGDFVVLASHPEFPNARITGEHDGPEEHEGLRINMPPGGAITGILRNVPDDANAIRIYAARAGGDQATSDGNEGTIRLNLGSVIEQFGGLNAEQYATPSEDGSFRIGGLKPGELYKIFAVHDLTGKGFPDRTNPEGGRRAWRALTRSTTQEARCSNTIETRPGGTASLTWQDTTSLTFQVVDANPGEPIESLEVRAGVERVIKIFGTEAPVAQTRKLPQTNYPGGMVTVPGLDLQEQVGKVRFTVTAAGYQPYEQKGLEVRKGRNQDLGVIRLQPATQVLITVLDATTGEPVEGADVMLRTPDDNGADFERLARDAGENAPTEGRRTVSMSFSVDTDTSSGDTASEVITAGDGGGRKRAKGVTGPDGTCRLTWGHGSEVSVLVDSDTHAPHRSETLTLPVSGGEILHTAQLLEGGSLQVSVLDSAGAPMADREFIHRAPTGSRMGSKLKTDGSGQAVLEHLAPGQHRVKLAKVKGDSDMGGFVVMTTVDRMQDDGWTDVQIQDRTRHSVELQETPKADLEGTVTMDGAPLVGARVEFLEGREADTEQEITSTITSRILGGGSGGRSKTDGAGRYTLTDKVMGQHRLKVSHPDLAMPSIIPVDVLQGDNVIDIPLALTVLRGVVHDENGNPLAGVTVEAGRAGGALGEVRQMFAVAADSGPMGAMLGGRTKKVTSDSSGRFELRGVAADTNLVLTLKADTRITTTREVDGLRMGEQRDLAPLRLLPGGAIEVTASGIGFGGLVSAECTAGEAEGETKRQVIMGGKTTLKGLAPGMWEVKIRTQGDKPQLPPQTIQVTAGNTATARFGG